MLFDRLLENRKFAFMQKSRISFKISIGVLFLSIVLFFVNGLNYGIDFKGGTLVQVRNNQGTINIAELRNTIAELKLGDFQIQHFGTQNEAIIRVEKQIGDDAQQQKSVEKIRSKLQNIYEIRRVELVGPTISAELVKNGIFAILIAFIAILFYIWIRFEWQFAVSAVATLLHDVITTIGIFSLLQIEFTISIIAAILTIIGYSLNDTVVVYDRIRENLGKYIKMPIDDLLDDALNKTLSRTILTSITTLLALVSLYLFGGEVLKGFSFALIWGVVIGTYSSIFFATPLLTIIGINRDQKLK